MKIKILRLKRALYAALLVLLLCAVGMTNAFAANYYDFAAVAANGQTLYYKITNATTHTVKVTHPYSSAYYPYNYGSNAYAKPAGDLIIPYYVEYNGVSYSVTAIDEYAFGTTYYDTYACTGLTSVVIPSSVLTIGKQAFAYCTGLTTVTIPTSVTSIDIEAFRYCSNLVTVNFNATNCSSVGSNTWDGCTKFTTLNIGNTVTRIPTQGFQGATKLVTVSLPNSLTSIKDYGFDGCTSLTTVTCGNASTLATIGNYAFQNCSVLANINLPNTLTSIGNYAFTGCTKLKSTTATQLLPNALTSIGHYAFQNAGTNSTSALAYIRIPSTLTSLGKYAFKGCTALAEVDYQATTCTYSGTQAEPPFYGCSTLATIHVGSNVTSVPPYCFKDCTALSSLDLQSGLTNIGTYAFYGCMNINPLVIPSSVNSIGGFAFGNAYDMQFTRVESHNPTPPIIGGVAAFPSGQTIHVPMGSINAYLSADYWRDYTILGIGNHYDFSEICPSGQVLYYNIIGTSPLTAKVTYANPCNDYYYYNYQKPTGQINIPSTVTHDNQTYNVIAIDSCAFKDCEGITAVTIPSSIVSIGNRAFHNCSGLTMVNYNAVNCTTMGSSTTLMFTGCTSLTTVNVGAGVTSIPPYAFKDCTHLNCNLVFPNSMITIGEEAFSGCSALTSQLNFPDAVTSIGDKAFYHCSNLFGNLRIGTAVTTIGASAFEGCSGLANLIMYNTLTQIGASAFEGCTGISGLVTIPNTVTHIGNSAFKGCSNMTSLSLGDALIVIGDSAFENCSAMASSIVLPNTVSSVGANAFAASGITSITTPYGLSSIGASSFKNCTNLEQITLQNTAIAESQFEGCTALTSVNIPNRIATMGDNAFKNCTGLTSVTLLNTTIGVSAFEGCTGLTTFNIPSSITNVGNRAFYGCSGLTDVSVPNTVTTIGASVFENCTSLVNVTLNNAIIGVFQFKGCSALAVFTIPEQITSVGNGALTNCINLTTLNYNAQNCSEMGSSELPVFGGSTAISTIYLNGSVLTIPNYAFKNCSQVTEIYSAPSTPPYFTGNNTQYGFVDLDQTIPVHVPCDKASTYMNVPYWNHFTNYIEGFPYNVTVVSNNNEMGNANITQEPSCSNNGVTVVTATPNSGFTFINWTKNGTVVSTNATYTFTPAEHTHLMANFVETILTIAVSADPVDGGVVAGGGSYGYGETVTVTASANLEYSFAHWTEDGNVVSTQSTYAFSAFSNRTLVAHFDHFSNHWTPESGSFEDNMTVTCVVQLDGVEQQTTMLELGAFCGEQCRGSQRATYFAPTQRYIIQMTVYGEAGDEISWRLFDHVQNEEIQLTPPASVTFNTNGYGSLYNPYILNFTSAVYVSVGVNPVGAGMVIGGGNYNPGTTAILIATANPGFQFLNWTKNGVVVSTNTTYSFTVTEAVSFVANFQHVHTQLLSNGWNWWSSYVELSDIDGLGQLENSLGSAGIMIKSRANGYVEAYEYNGSTGWYGTLTAINNEQMYKIRTNAECNAVVIGDAANPASHPITINSGWNWIGFPYKQSVSVDVAMAGFSPTANDVIKGRNSFTTYYVANGYSMWYGTLNSFEPGQGYMYQSNSTTAKTLTFQTGRSEMVLDNITPENNTFTPRDGGFADNMTITALVELNTEELRSEDYELAAFVGEECRGSVKLMYVEPIDHYIAFLTVFGEQDEILHFHLTDGTEVALSAIEQLFVADGMIGTLSDPFVIGFDCMSGMDENESVMVKVYPNPFEGIFSVEGQGIRKIEVFNGLGQCILSEESCNDFMQIDLRSHAMGLYTLRVITDTGVTMNQIIKQ